MRYFMMSFLTVLLISVSGCGGGGPELMGQMPRGYDIYITLDPEAMDLAGILETLENNLPDAVLENIENMDLDIDPFNWGEWKEEIGIQNGEIGIISLKDDETIVAFFLPCGDGLKLEEFIEDEDFGETEFFSYGEYTVMVITWDDDDLLDDLEDALGEEPLSSDEDYADMKDASGLDNPCIVFMFSKEVAEVSIYGVFSTDDDESILKVTVITDDDQIEQFSGMPGEGLLSGDIKFPEKTIAAARFTLNMDWLIEQYEDLADHSNNNNLRDIELGLPFVGFESMEDFLVLFQGDFCVALRELELDHNGEPENMEGILAISITDSERFNSILSMTAQMAEADTEDIDGATTHGMKDNDDDFWFFINDDVLYVSMNIDPEDIIEGISAGDYFQGGVASEGFMGGAADPEGILDGIHADYYVEEIITTLFETRVVFSVTANGQMFTSTVVAGPEVLESLIFLAAVIG